MVSSGEEQRIRTLFHELKLADEQITPRFLEARHPEQDRLEPGFPQERINSAPVRVSRALRFATALLVACGILFSVVLFFRHGQNQQPPNNSVATGAAGTPTGTAANPPPKNVAAQGDRSQVHRSRVPKPAVRLESAALLRLRIRRDAIAISRWQSPTAGFLHSPGDELLRSLPLLNQASREMEVFLPSRLN
jgi:hypothetical protein